MLKRCVAALAVFLVATVSNAHEYKIGDIVVDHPTATQTLPNAPAGAGYLVITNTGDAADQLIAVEAEFRGVSIHETIIDNDIARMREVDGISVAPGETVTLAPGGLHVMFMGLQGDGFEVGEKIPATLVFENAGRLEVVFNVEERSDAVDHSNHGN